MAEAAETVPQPGTPEYEAAYDKAFKGEKPDEAKGTASGTPASEGKPADDANAAPDDSAGTTADDEGAGADDKGSTTGDGKPDGGAPNLADLIDQNRNLSTQLQKAMKALTDTKQWGHKMSTRVREMESALSALKRGEKPQILEDMPDLEAAIKYVSTGEKPAGDGKPDGSDDLEPPAFEFEETTGKPKAAADPVKEWTEAVQEGLPADTADLLALPEFMAKVNERRNALGAEWRKPVVAIREIGNIRAEFMAKRAADAAAKKARDKSKMNLPEGGASGASGDASDQQSYDAVMNEPKDKFEQRRSRTLGY